MGRVVGFYYSIVWHSSYTEPPDGMPRVKAEMFESIEERNKRLKNGGPPVPAWFTEYHKIGDGYSICIQSITKPGKVLTKEKLAKLRRKKLERRIKNKYPMFAEQFISEELNRKSYYSGGVTDEKAEILRNKALEEDMKLYLRFLEETGKDENEG